MTTPPEPTPHQPPDRLTVDALRAQVRGLEEECERYIGMLDKLTTALTECRGQAAKLSHALKRYGTHAYTCKSEHGRYPARCSCGLHEVLR